MGCKEKFFKFALHTIAEHKRKYPKPEDGARITNIRDSVSLQIEFTCSITIIYYFFQKRKEIHFLY